MTNERELWEDTKKSVGLDTQRNISFGRYYSQQIDTDIKHIGFVCSRYKFASKMVENKPNFTLLELGCSCGFGSNFFLQLKNCQKIVGVDFDQDNIDLANENFASDKLQYLCDDFLGKDYRSNLECSGGGGSKF